MALTPPSDPRAWDAWWPERHPDIGYAEICTRHQITKAHVGHQPDHADALVTFHRNGRGGMELASYLDMANAWNRRKRIADLWALRKRRWLREAAFAFFRVHRLGQLPVSVPKDVVRLIVVHIKRGG